MDDALGYDHQRYIRERLLAPLGLEHTYGRMDDVDPATIAQGYDTHYEGGVRHLNFTFPGSSMVATAQDVGRFLRALHDGSLLSEEEQSVYRSVYVFEHTGLIPGYYSIARYHADIDTVVIQFVNTTGGESLSVADNLYNRIVRILRRPES